ncbi:MAG: hypothetical protein V3S64_12205, partial [bacterium]
MVSNGVGSREVAGRAGRQFWALHLNNLRLNNPRGYFTRGSRGNPHALNFTDPPVRPCNPATLRLCNRLWPIGRQSIITVTNEDFSGSRRSFGNLSMFGGKTMSKRNYYRFL